MKTGNRIIKIILIAIYQRKYSVESLDYLLHHTAEAAISFALHNITAVLKQHYLSCASIGLPTPPNY